MSTAWPIDSSSRLFQPLKVTAMFLTPGEDAIRHGGLQVNTFVLEAKVTVESCMEPFKLDSWSHTHVSTSNKITTYSQ